jgi:hypothetical protein
LPAAWTTLVICELRLVEMMPVGRSGLELERD